jgi:hypothetical protein
MYGFLQIKLLFYPHLIHRGFAIDLQGMVTIQIVCFARQQLWGTGTNIVG